MFLQRVPEARQPLCRPTRWQRAGHDPVDRSCRRSRRRSSTRVDGAGKVGVRGVDSRIHDRDHDARRPGCDVPRRGQIHRLICDRRGCGGKRVLERARIAGCLSGRDLRGGDRRVGPARELLEPRRLGQVRRPGLHADHGARRWLRRGVRDVGVDAGRRGDRGVDAGTCALCVRLADRGRARADRAPRRGCAVRACRRRRCASRSRAAAAATQ